MPPHDGALGYGAHWENIANVLLSFLDAVHKLFGVDVFNSNDQLHPLLKPVWIPEDHLDEGCATAWIMDDILHDALDVAVQLGEVHGAQTCGTLAVLHGCADH